METLNQCLKTQAMFGVLFSKQCLTTSSIFNEGFQLVNWVHTLMCWGRYLFQGIW